MNYDKALFEGIHGCRDCRLSEFRLEAGTLAVPSLPGKHYTAGGLAVLCEAPGADEEVDGAPLVGRAGRLFDQMLKAAGLHRDNLLLMNRVRCRPPGNRIKDWPEAVAACDEWTGKELAEYNPAVVVLMGATAMSAIFGAKVRVTQTRGTFAAKGPKHEWGARMYGSTFHPSAALRNGGLTGDVARYIIQDLKTAAVVLDWTKVVT